MQKEAALSLAGNERPVVINQLQKNNSTTPGYFARYSSELNGNGWPIIPINPGTKEPYPVGWQVYANKPLHQRTLNRWIETCPEHSIGIVCGRIIAIDIDILNPVLADKLAGLVRSAFGHTPLTRIGQAPKAIYVYRTREAIPSRQLSIEGGLVEILAEGRQFVAYGVHPITQRPYYWEQANEGGEPLATSVESLPEITAEDAERFEAGVEALFKVVRPTRAKRDKIESDSREVVRHRGTGLVIEGREKHLRNIVLATCRAAPPQNAALIELAIWDEFQATTDLSRPKGSGRPYSLSDVKTKVRATIRKLAKGGIKRAERSQFKRAPKQAPDIAPGEVEAFRRLVAYRIELDRLASSDDCKLTDAAGAVAGFMLDRLQEGQFSDTAGYIARGIGLAEITVKKARRALVAAGLFNRARQLARVQSAPYWPNPLKVAQAVEQYGLSAGGVYQNIPNTIREVPLCSGNDNQEPAREWAPVTEVEVERLGHPSKDGPADDDDGRWLGQSALPKSDVYEGAKNLALREVRASARTAAPVVIMEHDIQGDLLPFMAEGAPSAWEAPPSVHHYAGGIIPLDIRRAVQERKRALGAKQEEIARMVGISRPQLANALQGRFGLSPEAAARLVAWLLAPRPSTQVA